MEAGARVLGSLRTGMRGVIDALPDDDDLRRDLAALRLLPGEAIEVVQALPLGGPVLVRTSGGLYALGRRLADRVRIRA